MNNKIFLPFLILLLILVGCPSTDEGCDDCGGTIMDGYYFDEITIEDLAELGGVDEIEDIEVGACIRYKLELDGGEFDLETVTVVDDCCCAE